MGRARQGRHARHLLRRHQPAVHRRDPAAEPRRDHAAVGDRRRRRRRSTRAASSTPGFAFDWAKERVHEADARRARTRASAGPTSGSRRATRSCKDNQALHPEAADLIGKVRDNDHYVPEVADPLVAGHVRRQDQRAGRSWPASSPTSRPAATARRSPQRMTGTRQEVVHVHQRHARRLARPRDLQPAVRLPADLRRARRRRSRKAALIQRAARRWSSRRSSASTA